MNNGYGIKSDSGNVIITKNVIMYNSDGVNLRDSRQRLESKPIIKLYHNEITDNYVNIRAGGTSLDVRNNNLSQIFSPTYENSSILLSGNNMRLTVKNNIITDITILNNISNSEKNFRYNYWDGGDVDIFYMYEDHYNWTHPVLKTKPEVDLS